MCAGAVQPLHVPVTFDRRKPVLPCPLAFGWRRGGHSLAGGFGQLCWGRWKTKCPPKFVAAPEHCRTFVAVIEPRRTVAFGSERRRRHVDVPAACELRKGTLKCAAALVPNKRPMIASAVREPNKRPMICSVAREPDKGPIVGSAAREANEGPIVGSAVRAKGPL